MKLTIEKALQEGITAHKEGKLQDAERLYRAILQAQPNHPDANHNLGALAIAVGKPLEGIPFFKLALEANSQIEQFWLSYIDALIKLERFDEAKRVSVECERSGVASEKLQLLRQQIQASSSDDKKNRRQGLKVSEKRKMLAEEKKGKQGKAQTTPSGAVPSQDQINRLLEHYQSDRFADTEDLAESLTQQFPSHPFAWKVLGVVVKQAGRLNEALLPLHKSVELSPHDAEAHSNLGNTLQELGRLDESEASCRQAIALKPDFAEAHYNLGVTLQALGRLDEAEASYRQAIALKPAFADAHNNLGNTLKELGRLDESEASCRQAIALKPGYAAAHSNLGVTLQELGRLDESEASFRQAMALEPDYADAHNNLGVTLQELGRLEDAEASYRRAIALKPSKFVYAYDQLGVILQKKGKFEEAEIYYRKCIALEPNKTPKTVSNGSILFKQGLFEQALIAFEEYEDANSTAQTLEALYALGRIDDIYERIERRADLDDCNLRVAAIAAFLSERENKNTAHRFCNNPLDFIYVTNIGSRIKEPEAYCASVIHELRDVKTEWEPRTTQNGFQASIDVFKNPSEQMGILKSIIVNEIDTYYSRFEKESCSFIKKFPAERHIEGWHVILKQQGHQTGHIHPYGWLSGVIYLSVVPSLGSNEGAIEFSLDGPNYLNAGSSKKIHQPRLGDMVFFPSSLHHRTLPFSTDMDRVCVSFDLMPCLAKH